jgi:DNA-binding transcriptional LysR family regulator/predicted ATPase
MELEARVRAFAAVAREGSFSRAAQSLYVSQPAVSKHLAALEAELGKQLVVRDRRGATLTPAGQILADYVLRAEALLANARRALGAGEEAQIGTLSLAASGIPGTYLLPPLLARFRELHPAVEIDFRTTTSRGALDLVRAHEVEVGVVGGLVVPPELESESIADDEIVLIGPPSLGGRRLRPRDLENHTWISREEGSATRAAVEVARWQAGLRDVRVLELPSWEAVKLAVAAGAGIAAISRVAVDVELAAGTIAVLDVPRWRLQRTIALVRARDVPLTPPAERFVALLQERFAPPEEPPLLPPNSNLVVPTTSLIGRAPEVEGLARTLSARETRLVTVHGPAGVGKTRLAVEAAARVVDAYADGVYFVDLSPVVEPALVLPTIASALAAEETKLGERLREAQLLLVLDNFEQVVDAAGEVGALLDESRGVTALVTSRIRLALPREEAVPLEPLAPDDATALFAVRARSVDPGFIPDDDVDALCERLDRLPLAIELVAARADAFSPAALLDGLHPVVPLLSARGVPERHRTLLNAIAWSYELLDDAGRQALRRLAIFAGGFTAAAANAVCDVDAPTLATLVENNLLRLAGTRFTMLETVREFAAGQLDASGERAQLLRRLAERLLDVAREASAHARGPEEAHWFSVLEAERANVRTALAFTVEEAPELGLALAAAHEPLWWRHAILVEGLYWLEQLLPERKNAPADVVATALALAGRLAAESGRLDDAEPWYREALELARAEGNDTQTAWALHGLGHIAYERGDLATGRELLEKSLELFERLGERGPAGGRLTYLAEIAFRESDPDAAEAYLLRSLEHFEAAGDLSGVAAAAHGLGDVAALRGDFSDALVRYREMLSYWHVDPDRSLLAYAAAASAGALGALGRQREAGLLWGAAQHLDDEVDLKIRAPDRAAYTARAGKLRPDDVAAGKRLSDEEVVELLERVL